MQITCKIKAWYNKCKGESKMVGSKNNSKQDD